MKISIAHLAALGVISCSFVSPAQFLEAPDVPRTVLNSPALQPPAGTRVAIIEFDDMQCPLCAAWNPILMQAVAKYHVPWVRHDFLIPGHPWSPQEAVTARWFDNKSQTLGAAYRNTVFAQQQNIETQDDLTHCTEQFAKAHNIAMPFAIDPQGTLMDAVRADCQLGKSLGVYQTPTVYVVTSGTHEGGYSIARVRDLNLLSTYLDQAMSATTDKNVRKRTKSS